MTIAIDASAITELLASTTLARRAAVVEAMGDELHWVVLEHFTLEAISAFRGQLLGRHLDRARFTDAVAAFRELEFDVRPTAGLVARILELAENATPHDAAYLALAEELGRLLVTADARLARVPGISCRVVGWE